MELVKMKLKMKMPDLSANEAEIKIVKWLIEPGQPVKRGQALLEVETDKATVEVESIASGVLVEIYAKVEQKVTVGEVIAAIAVADLAGSAGAV
jgi:pyruvate/2-oxoglutarate dehydrogenase complex dihydrolipoamide acyltransferase (E2) component